MSSGTSTSIKAPYEFKYARTTPLARLFIKKGLPKYLTIEQLAMLFQVHKETLRRWTIRGEIKSIRVQKGQRSDRRFLKDEVLTILDRGLRKKNE